MGPGRIRRKGKAMTESERRDLMDNTCTLNGEPAVISGARCDFAQVRHLMPPQFGAMYAWETVRYVITEKGGNFRA